MLAADRAAFGTANQRFRSEKQSIRGATGMAQNSLAQALRGLKSSGLQGRYLRQTTQELTARQGDVAGSVPFLISDAARERGEASQTARSELVSDQALMQKSAAEVFNQLLKEERGKASTVLKQRAKDKAPGSELGSDPRALKTALLASITSYQALLKDSGKWVKGGELVEPETEGATKIQVPRTDQEWRAFILHTANVEGADAVDVANAVKRLRARIEKKVREGDLRPLGIRFNAG